MKRIRSAIKYIQKSCSSIFCVHERERKREKTSSIEPPYVEIEEQPLNPRFVLTSKGSDSSTRRHYDERIPLFLTDVLDFLLLAILNSNQFYYFTCNWIDIEKKEKISKSYILIIEGLGLNHFMNSMHKFRNLSNAFRTSCSEVLNVPTHAIINTMSLLPVILLKKDSLMSKFGCMDVCLDRLNDPNAMLRTIFPIAEEYNHEKTYVPIVSFNRLSLLLTPSEMLYERYPLPMPGKMRRNNSDYVFTKEEYKPVTENSPMFGLDCERCNTLGGSELYRVSIVDEFDNVVFNSYVLPEYEIVGNRDRFSGINRRQLLEVKTRRADVQRDIRNILPSDAILIGHSLNYDLHALHMMHPYVINTSCIYNMRGSRRWKSKLREFTWEYLSREIQNSSKGHCSIEDATASIDLVKLKLANSAQFGDIILQRHIEHHKRERASNTIKDVYNTPAILANKEILNKYLRTLQALCFDNCQCSSNVERVECEDIKSVASNTVELLKQRKFILTHLVIDTVDDTSIAEVDRLINTIWNSSTRETLLTVLFAGNRSNNGAVFYNIKVE